MKNKEVFDNDTQIPVVGKFYWVRCAIMECFNRTLDVVPIIGNKHSDAQFGFNHNHYHIDGRFTNIYTDQMGYTNGVLETENATANGKFLRIEIRKKKCVRLTTGIKPPANAKRYMEWYKTMIGKSCKGKKCPHLGATMLEVGGALVCPLHKLRGDKITEKIIDYAE